MTLIFWYSWEVLNPSKKWIKGSLALMAERWAAQARSITSWILDETSMGAPVWRQAITSWWSPNIDRAWVAMALAETCNAPGRSSPTILYMLGIIKRIPWDAV